MKIFIDSANLDEIKTALAWNMAEGVTTNPSSLGKSGKEPVSLVKEICKIIQGPVSMQVTADNTVDMVKEGKKIAAMAKNIVVKVPCNREGLNAILEFKKLRIKVNATNLFTPAQALIAARNGASYVSTWVGRTTDFNIDGMQLVYDTRQIFDNYNIKAEILACSIRDVPQFVEVAKAGADIVTIPFSTASLLTNHPMTDFTFDAFLKDWSSNPALKKSSK